MQDTKRVIVVTRKRDKGVVWKHIARQPDEESMLCEDWRSQVAANSGKRLAHLGPRPHVHPPARLTEFAAASRSLGLDPALDVLERQLVLRRLVLRHVNSEINDPMSTWPPRDVEPVDPREQHVSI